MITVDLGHGIQLMDTRELVGPLFEVRDNEHEFTVATRYELNGRTVHRGVHVTLKRGIGIEAITGVFGG